MLSEGLTRDTRGQVILPELDGKASFDKSVSALKGYLRESWRA